VSKVELSDLWMKMPPKIRLEKNEHL